MKNLIKFSLVVAMVVACSTASAVFTDSLNTYALWHCDATNWAGTLETTPDDNSSGRTAHNLEINQQNEVTMMPGSPYGGDYLAYDGTDHSTAWGALDPMPTNYLHLNVSFRMNAFPADGAYKSILWTGPMRVMLWNNGGTTHLGILRYDAAVQATWLWSSKLPSLDTWYTVDTISAGTSEQLIFGNDTDGYTTNDMTVGAGFWDGANYICVGWDPQGGSREVDGDIDEILVKNIPEPFTFGLIGLVGFLALRRK